MFLETSIEFFRSQKPFPKLATILSKESRFNLIMIALLFVALGGTFLGIVLFLLGVFSPST